MAAALDVTDRARIASAVAAAKGRFGAVDALVNNAGYGCLSAIEEGEDAGLRALFDTALFGPINMIQAAPPAMRAGRRGRIVNSSSIGPEEIGPRFRADILPCDS